MIKLEKTEVLGWEHAIRGMRNPMNSWEKSDSHECSFGDCPRCEYFREDNLVSGNVENMCARPNENPHYMVGPNDHELMMKLAKGGPVHAKYRRMIVVYVDITAPLYWWKEFDTYKVGTVANSCSTMHKIHEKEFTLEDFSCEHLISPYSPGDERDFPNVDLSGVGDGSNMYTPNGIMRCAIIPMLNICREKFLETEDKKYWWQMIQLLPSSYNQKRTVMLNYEVLAGLYPMRKNHKLDEWREFCAWVEKLPYSELIVGEVKE